MQQKDNDQFSFINEKIKEKPDTVLMVQFQMFALL